MALQTSAATTTTGAAAPPAATGRAPELTFSAAINQAIREEMRRDPTIVVIGEDVAGAAGRAHLGLVDAWGGPTRSTRGLVLEFGPERVLDTPISEMGFLGAALGAAMSGLRPIVDLGFVDLIGCCYDQLVNQAAKMHYMMGGQVTIPLTVRMSYGARPPTGQTVGGGAAAQHSQTLYAVLAHVPGLKVVAPTTAYNAKGLLIAAIRDDNPVVILEHRYLGPRARGAVPDEPYTLPLGKADVVRPGRDITLCGIGRMTHVCVEAAERLAAHGLEAEVVDVLSLAPLDVATILESVQHTKRLVVVDEDTPTCSVAHTIAARVADEGFDLLDAPIKTLNSVDAPVPYSAALEAEYTPTPDKVIVAVHSIFGM
ncbi:MAG: alpha-ketoacid dehydrogenase subunit beta [Chloroflexi bacterium]|nr:alpha-ketoacid dehydrogenase subunit beta [Chloroflexota bacterium]